MSDGDSLTVSVEVEIPEGVVAAFGDVVASRMVSTFLRSGD